MEQEGRLIAILLLFCLRNLRVEKHGLELLEMNYHLILRKYGLKYIEIN